MTPMIPRIHIRTCIGTTGISGSPMMMARFRRCDD